MRPFDRPAYLGLDTNPQWLGWVTEGLSLYGTHYAGSRRASYCPMIYGDLETQLAAWLQAPAALTAASGSWLAIQVLDLLQAQGYQILLGPAAHRCWHRPGVESFAEADRWRQESLFRAAAGEKIAVVSDRVQPILCTAPALEWWAQLPDSACVVIDDSHALGVLGKGGRGSWPDLDRLSASALVSASLGKAFSTPGAVVVGPGAWLGEMRSTAAFGGASALPPAYAHALLEGLDYALEQREKLLAHVGVLADSGLHHAPGHPAFRLTAEQSAALRAAGVTISASPYPQATSEPVERLVVSAGHTQAEIARVVAALRG